MDTLFGSEGSLIVRFVVAFVIVLALIGLTFWLIRRFGGARVGQQAQRGRQPRLAVIDAAPIDGRRRLVLVRRDNVEHLLMIGGPTDVVVEQNILRAVPVNAPRDMPVPRQGAESRAETARAQPLDEDWPQAEPAAPRYQRAEPAPPAARPRLPVEPPRPVAVERPQPEPRAAFAEPAARAAPLAAAPLAAAPLARDVVPPPIVPAAEPAAEPSAPDAALASMAQRLEAALRRPNTPETRAPAMQEQEPDPEFVATEPAPSTAPEAPPQGDKAPRSKSVLDSLEAEMASLLGRPPERQ